MSATSYGTAFVYGISATSPAASQIVSYSLSKSDQNVNAVEDGDGKTIARRTDSQQDALELELKFTSSFTEPAIGSVLTVVDGGTPSIAGEYMVQTAVNSGQTKDFKTYRVTALKDEYLDLTPP